MAITIKSNPQLYEPVYNPMMYVLSSTNVANSEFKFLVDIFIAGAGTYEASLRIDPEPDNNYGIVDVSEIISSFLTFDIGDPADNLGTYASDNSIVDYIVKFGEEYVSGGSVVQNRNLTVDSSRYAWNGSFNYTDHTSIGYLTYFLDDSAADFLTKAPSSINTMSDSSGWLYWFHSAAPAIETFEVETFNSSGASLGTWRIKNSLTFADTGEYMGRVAAHPVSLNALDNVEFSLGSQPVITSETASYTIFARQSTGTALSVTRTYNIIDPCRFDRWNVIFLNRLGGFDSFPFTMLSRDEDEIERINYKKNPTRVTAAGNYPFALSDRQKTTFFTRSVKKRTLHSDWISEDESEWLEELLSSPVVYLEDTNNTLIAVRVSNNKWIKQTRVNDKLFNLTLELELWDNYRQRG